MKSVYLAGGLRDDWQDRVMSAVSGFEYFDPRSWQATDPVVYTKLDLAHIESADIVFVYMNSDNPSGFGLSVELGFAKALGVFVIFVDDFDDADPRKRYFDMHRQMSDIVVHSLSEAYTYLRSFR